MGNDREQGDDTQQEFRNELQSCFCYLQFIFDLSPAVNALAHAGIAAVNGNMLTFEE